jgi:Leucine-rich repeat (LRR) protein
VPDLGILTALLNIDMSNNKLEGPVPTSLINLPSITILNMSVNRLVGTLPVVQSNSSLSIADFSYNLLTLTTVDMPSVHRLFLRDNKYAGKGNDLTVKLSSSGASVDLRGNPFKCSYPAGQP